MINFGLRLDGSKAAVDRIRALRQRYELAYRAAVYMFAQEVMTEAVKLCPVDTGTLRKSRYVERPTHDGDRFRIVLGFSAPYAIWVHEIHKRYVVGEWKFLSSAIAHAAPRALDRIAALTAAAATGGLTPDKVAAVHPTEPPQAERPVVRHSAATRRKRDKARGRNQERIRRESVAGLDAQRKGLRSPRFGRG